MASIYDKASLVLIPSGTKTSKVYSQVPTNGDGDFTFSRSTAATRVNASGNIEKETQNLLVQSNNFDTTWQIGGYGTITENQAGYDGTNNASLLTKLAAWTNVNQNVSQSGVQTFSVYVKANASTWALLVADHPSTDPIAYFDLTNGVVGSTTHMLDPNIVDVGNGWWRISITYNMSISQVRVYPAEANTASGTLGSIYIQDAQLEQGLVARDYIETTTTAIYEGITDNVPRLDYTDSSCPALLLEPQRTNLVPHSEYLGAWNKSTGAITITPNYGVSPEGLQNSSRVQFTSSSQHINISTSLGIGVTSTGSVYIKGNAGETIQFDTGGVGALRTLTGDWQRIEVTSISVSPLLLINTFGGATARDIEVWGAQVEQGSYATSYIPTYGSAVTRNNDYMNLVATNFYSTTSYTYFLDIDLPYDVGTSSALWKDNDNLSSNGGFQLRKTSPTGSYVGITTHNGSSFTGFFTNVLTGRLKLAIIYNNGQVSVYYNGVQSGSAISVTGWNQSTNHFKFEDGSYGAYETNQFLYLPTALTDQEAIDLTTL